MASMVGKGSVLLVDRNSNPWHVLVIDDDPELVALYREFLEDEGFRVTVEPSPGMHLASIQALAPDVILVDLLFAHEPRGYDLIARLKAHPATRDVPVLVCSADAYRLQELSEQLLAWDCGVLLKPFSLDALLEAITACLPSSSKTAFTSLPASIALMEEPAS